MQAFPRGRKEFSWLPDSIFLYPFEARPVATHPSHNSKLELERREHVLHHRVFFQLRIAGGLCCAALIAICAADADGVTNLTLRFAGQDSLSRQFLYAHVSLAAAIRPQTDEVRERVKQLSAKMASSTRWIT